MKDLKQLVSKTRDLRGAALQGVMSRDVDTVVSDSGDAAILASSSYILSEHKQWVADAEFITHAANNIGTLLDIIETLADGLSEIRQGQDDKGKPYSTEDMMRMARDTIRLSDLMARNI